MEPHRQFAILLGTLLVAVGLPLWAVQANEPDITVLPGEIWARGDGLGYNVALNLGTNGHYVATWHGCLGLYGTAKGTWIIRSGQVVLTPTKERDMMKGHLRTLQILSIHGQKVLVPPEEVEDARTFPMDLELNSYAFTLERVVGPTGSSER